MSNEKQETIADIINEKRTTAREIRSTTSNQYGRELAVMLEAEADRIEAAYKREREDGAEAAQICGEIGELIWREAACKQSVTNCNRLGNAAKMRDALLIARKAICHHAEYVCRSLSLENRNIQSNCADILCAHRDLCEAKTAIDAALSAPPRNCDVGTVEEQVERFQWFCDTRPCDGCTLKNKVNETLDCAIHWAQLPYEEGGSK